METVDAIVIGAGVVGLAAARALALAGREVIILEAEDTIGTHTSSRNSEVIHAGIYYPKDSLKARLCVAGRRALYTYCAANDGRAFLHSQAGLDSDDGFTAGTRIPVGTEPPLLEHLFTVAPLHPYFPSGVSDVLAFDDTAVGNPQAVVDIIRGALAEGMRDVTFNLDSNDFIRITGYLVRKSDLAKLPEQGARHGSTLLGVGSVERSHVTERAAKRVTAQLIRVPDSEETAGKAGIDEV